MKRPKPCTDNSLSLFLFSKFYQADRSGEKFLVTQINDDNMVINELGNEGYCFLCNFSCTANDEP